MAIADYIDGRDLYDLMGPSHYALLTRCVEWQGPQDMQTILAHVPLSGATVADFAIGTGELSATFRQEGVKHIIGIDASQSYLNHCLANQKADEIHQVDLSRQPVPMDDDSVDLSTCSGLFSYLCNPEALSWEMTRITRPGGYIAVNFHPRDGASSVELLPAGAWGVGKHVMVTHHDPNLIADLFYDCGAELAQVRKNKTGVLRIYSNTHVPLETHLYRMRGPA